MFLQRLELDELFLNIPMEPEFFDHLDIKNDWHETLDNAGI